MDPYKHCIFRDDRACTAAPFYGSCDCDWAVDNEECPEPAAAISSLREVQQEVAELTEAHQGYEQMSLTKRR